MKVSVYLGSSTTCLEEYNTLAYELGFKLCKAGHTIVYGGSDVGTMKYLADGAEAANGTIIGVFPKGFRGSVEVQGMKVVRDGLSDFIWTEDFAERKKVMEDLGDCCIVMPGSYGTLDELFTYACGRSISKHSKQIYLLNHKGYYSPIGQLIENMSNAGFLKPSTIGIIEFCDDIDAILDKLL